MKNLDKLWKKGTEFLNSEYAIMGGAMTWVSESGLVSAISNAGGFGVLACGAMQPAMLSEEIKKTQSKTKNSFGVNLIVMHPALDQLIDVCIENKVSHVVLAGGLPKQPSITKLKEAGVKIICFAPAYTIAKKLVKMGTDALVIEGNEAGGHIGPVSTSVLAQEVLPLVNKDMPNIPVFVAGGIGRGEAIASYLEMGASGVQLGTRFVCSPECIAHPNFKRSFIRAAARDAVASAQIDPEFPVIPVRALANKATDDFIKLQRQTIDDYKSGKLEKAEAQLKIEHFWAGALRRAVVEGDVERGSLMAGQSVGMVTKEQPIAEIIAELTSQAENYLAG